MIKKILLFLLLFTVYCLLPKRTLASDFTVTCAQEGPCAMNFSSPPHLSELFFEENILPGYSVTRTITFINQDPTYNCPLTLEAKNPTQTPSDFASKLITYIKDRDAGTYLYGESGKTLNDLYGAGIVSLANIPAGGTKHFDWTVTFDPATGNAYQGAKTVFDFDLDFSCGGPEVSPSPSPSSSSSSTTTTNGGTTTTAAGGDGIGGGPGAAASTTSWGPFVFTPGGFLGGILGAVEGVLEKPAVEGAAEEKPPEVKGEAVCPWWDYLWWLPLIIQGLLIFLYYYWLKVRDADAKGIRMPAWWIMPIALSVVSQIIHEILGCRCVQSGWCQWYWLFNLIILAGLTYYYLRRRQRQSSNLTEE